MSYSVVYLPVKTVQGETILVADVPVEELSRTAADVFGQKVSQLWPSLMAGTMAQVDAYAEQKLWPAIRAEVDHAASRAKSQVTWVGLGSAAIAISYLVYLWRR